MVRTARRCAPTSRVRSRHRVFNILHTARVSAAKFRVHLREVSIFLIIRPLTLPTPRIPPMTAQPTLDRAAARSLLDAVHGQPAVQGQPAPAGHAPRACTTGRPTAGRSSTASRACGASTPATAAARSPRRSAARSPRWTTRRRSRWATRPRSSSPNEVVRWLPDGLDHVFFTNSGSESVDTALKIALAYHRARGEGTRTRFIGRERGYHGVGFGGISVGGMVNNRKFFGTHAAGRRPPAAHARPRAQRLLARPAGMGRAPRRRARAHRRAARREQHRRGDRRAGGGLDRRADAAARAICKRLREICTKHGILLIFDEVITGFGRLGAPFGAEYFGVTPDMITMAKGLTNGAVPMGAVAAQQADLRRVHARPGGRHRAVPRLHLLGASGGLRRRPRHAGDLPATRAC